MITFKNEYESHEHSLLTLNELYNYDSFLDSLKNIADFGCGTGRDVQWWANLMTRDDPPVPRRYKVHACDHAVNKLLDAEVRDYANVHPAEIDIDSGEDPPLSVEVDFIWSHNTFQYITNPIKTLAGWNRQLVEDGMLMMVFPQATYYQYTRPVVHSPSGCYYNHNLIHLMYMLAVNGFDCNDGFFKKEPDDPWIHVAVYKSSHEPMDPKKTTWFDLADKGLINTTVVDCLNRFSYVRQEEILTLWIDKDFRFPDTIKRIDG